MLTFAVPYCVTTWGAITGKLQRIMMHVQELVDNNKIMELSFLTLIR